MRVGVVTDSSCDLPAATLRRVRVEAVPLRIGVGDEMYLDWRNIEPATLYDWMENQGVVPTVRSPAPEDFMHAYRQGFQRYDALVSIHLSARFSHTFEHARLAAERLGVEERVTLIDSGYVSAGLAEIVLAATRLARQGATAEGVKNASERIRDELYGAICPTGGRWGHNGDWLSGLRMRRHEALGHRRLLGIRHGELWPLSWERNDRVPEALARVLEKRFGERPLHLTVAYGGTDPDGLERLRTAMEQSRLVIARGRVQLIGAAVGARLGAGSAGVFARPADPGRPAP